MVSRLDWKLIANQPALYMQLKGARNETRTSGKRVAGNYDAVKDARWGCGLYKRNRVRITDCVRKIKIQSQLRKPMLSMKSVILFFLVATVFPFMAPPAFSVGDARKDALDKSRFFDIQTGGYVFSERFSFAAAWLAENLSKLHREWKFTTSANQPNIRIELKTLGKDKDIPYSPDDQRHEDSYRIVIKEEKIEIYSGGNSGAIYAAKKLMDMVGAGGGKLHFSAMVDYPEYQWRFVFINPANTRCGDAARIHRIGKNEWLRCMKQKVDEYVALRFNAILLFSPVFARMSDEDVHLLKDLYSYAKNNGVEIVPIIDTKLWGIPEDHLQTDAVEGIFNKKKRFLVRNGYLVPENQNQRLLRWPTRRLLRESWKDQSKNADKWTVAIHPERDHGGDKKRYFSIVLSHNDDPWKSSLLLREGSGGTRIKVNPNTYYEFGLKVRALGKIRGRVYVSVDQYDWAGRRIKGLNRYPVKLTAKNGDYEKRWVPIFTSPWSYSVSIRLAPQVEPGRKGFIELQLADIELREMGSGLVNVLENQETRPIIESAKENRIYVQDKDYEIESGAIREWKNHSFEEIRPMRVKILPDSGLSDGDVVLVSYDSLPLEYRGIPSSKYSAASIYTYQEFSRLFHQYKKLSPKFLMVGFDEHYGGLNRDSRSRKLERTNRELLIEYINTLELQLKKSGPIQTPGGYVNGAGMDYTTMIIWDDMINPWHNGGDPLYQIRYGGIEGATGFSVDEERGDLSKSVWLASWWYSERDFKGVVKNSPKFYSNLGYRFIASTWYQTGGIENWFRFATPDLAQGVMVTTWDGRTGGVKMVSCLGWNRKKHSSCKIGE